MFIIRLLLFFVHAEHNVCVKHFICELKAHLATIYLLCTTIFFCLNGWRCLCANYHVKSRQHFDTADFEKLFQ